jgi:hypothetical protein
MNETSVRFRVTFRSGRVMTVSGIGCMDRHYARARARWPVTA